MAATPASIFMARSISSAAVSSGTLPISLEVHTHRVAREHGNRGIGGTTASACTSAGGVHLGQSGNSARLNGFQLFPSGMPSSKSSSSSDSSFFIFDDIVSGKRDVVDGFLGFILLYGRISFGSRHRCYPFAVKRGIGALKIQLISLPLFLMFVRDSPHDFRK